MNPQALYWLNGSWQSLEVENAENLDNLDSTDFSLANHRHFKSDITDLPGNATTAQDGFMSAADKVKLNGIAEKANNYTHPTTSGNKHIPSGGSSGQILRWSADGTAVWGADNNTTYSNATQTTSGLMSSTDKTKLDGIAANANNYTHPTSDGNKHVPANGTGNNGKFLQATATAGTYQWASLPTASTSVSGITKLNNTISSTSTTEAATANAVKTAYDKANHTHPYASTAVATTAANGLMSASDKKKLDGISEGAGIYTHPTGDGNKHVPANGTSNNGKYLQATSTAGTYQWATLPSASTTSAGIVQLNDTVTSTSTILAATANAVKTAYDKANHTHPYAASSHTHTKSQISDFPTSLPANGGNAATVNGKTVESSVPANAVFTDTTYGIATTSVNGLMSTTMVTKLNGIATNANNYVHPTTSGNKHIPSGGSSGQYLKWSSAGTATWADIEGGGAANIKDGTAQGSIISTSPIPGVDFSVGAYSFAFGQYAHATHDDAIAIGNGTMATNYGAVAIGSNTEASGSASLAEGSQTLASGQASHAEGAASQATEYCAHAEGWNTRATGMRSHSEGQATEASGQNAHAEGYYCVASGNHSHAQGYLTQALGDGAHAEGYSYNGYTNTAYIASHSEGIGCQAGKTNSGIITNIGGCHAEGIYTVATGAGSHAEGQKTNASAMYSHAEGTSTVASGYGSHAEGVTTQATGYASHSQGCNSLASSYYSHAEGYATTAKAYCSHAEGNNTTAHNYGCHVQGRYNLHNYMGSTSSYSANSNAFVIGNGSSSAESNAFRVTFSGASYGLSAFNSTGADYAEYFEWLDGNPNNEDRIGHFVALDGSKIRFAGSEDDYIIGIISGNQSIIGNACEDGWNDMYARDEFDRLQYEDVEIEIEESILNKETGEIEKIKKKTIETVIKLNPNYNPNMRYIPRSKRSEWGIVGMLGQIKVRDDGTCKVNSYCKPSKNGIATHSDDKSHYRVIERINDHLIKVVFK